MAIKCILWSRQLFNSIIRIRRRNIHSKDNWEKLKTCFNKDIVILLQFVSLECYSIQCENEKKKSILIHNVKTWIVCKTRLPLDNCLLWSLHWWKLKVQLTLFWTNLQFFLSLAKVDNDLTTFFPSHVPLKDKQTNKQTLFRTKDKILFIFLEKKILDFDF